MARKKLTNKIIDTELTASNSSWKRVGDYIGWDSSLIFKCISCNYEKFCRYNYIHINNYCDGCYNLQFKASNIDNKICKGCKNEKNKYKFSKDIATIDGLCNWCKECVSLYKKKYYNQNKSLLLINSQDYYINNKEVLIDKSRNWYKNNKEYKLQYDKERYEIKKDEISEKQKIYYQNNKKDIIIKTGNYIKNRYKLDGQFRLKNQISGAVGKYLKKKGLKKYGNSIVDFLPYPIEDLNKHLELLFESWMNWNNYGNYRLDKWDDNDISTWRWSLDHIMPHCKFNYSSMRDEEFKKCWSLDNLRPLSAKENLLKGNKVINE